MTAPSLTPAPVRRSHPFDRPARRAAFALLEHIHGGEVIVVDGGVRHRFGDRGGDGLTATVRVIARHAYQAGLSGSSGLARSYIDGLWDCDDLVALVRILCRNFGTLDTMRGRLLPVAEPLHRVRTWLRGTNTRRRSRTRIGAHYDIGDDLFASMLDETMAYSCAVFPHPDATLAEAQTHKMDMICRKLRLGPGDHVVEIGTGWGGFALHAATRYRCTVTTTTISDNQYAYATERIARAGLSGRVRVLLEDYRDLRGRYDRLVSIEMIEAVGWEHFDTFFRTCARLLRSDGTMLVQAIITSDGLYRRWRAASGFANTIIFPGGCLPSMEAMRDSAARVSDLRVVDVEEITPHYVRTLRMWRDRFRANAGQLDPERYDSRFKRFWELYLSYCEGAFAERRIQDVQVVMAGPEVAHPATKSSDIVIPRRARMAAGNRTAISG